MLKIGQKKLVEYHGNLDEVNEDDDVLERFRFVVTKTAQEREILLNVEPVKVYLRYCDMIS